MLDGFRDAVYRAQSLQQDNGMYNWGYNTSGTPTVNPNDDEYASKTYANLIRSEYGDYQQRFQPYEQRLMDYASSRDLLDQQLSRISANVNNAYNNQNLSAGNIMSQRYGLSRTAQEQQSNARQTGLQRALSTAHAKNNTRQADYDQRMGIITGSNNARSLATNDATGG